MGDQEKIMWKLQGYWFLALEEGMSSTKGASERKELLEK